MSKYISRFPLYRILLVIPAFNAQDSIEEVVNNSSQWGHPILIVNDGSSDGTKEILMKIPFIHCLSHPRNRGKGAALRSSFQFAWNQGYTHVLTLDADGQHPSEVIPEMIAFSKKNPATIVIGNRFHDAHGEMPFHRRLSNRCSSYVISMVVGMRIPDAQCGMRIYPLGPMKSMKPLSNGYEFETEVLIHARKSKIPVGNIPIPCQYPRGTLGSRYRAIRDSWKIAKILIKTSWS